MHFSYSSPVRRSSFASANLAMAIVVSFMLLVPASRLCGQTWVGTTTNWNTTTNWSTGVLPTAATAVTFGNPTGGNYNLTFTAAGVADSLTFTNAGTTGYTLNTSGDTLTIDGGGITNNNTF